MTSKIVKIQSYSGSTSKVGFAMSPSRQALLYFLLATVVIATTATNTTFTGCNLRVPRDVQDHMEAKGEPLVITIIMIIKFVRDVPDSGGSFGVDVG